MSKARRHGNQTRGTVVSLHAQSGGHTERHNNNRPFVCLFSIAMHRGCLIRFSCASPLAVINLPGSLLAAPSFGLSGTRCTQVHTHERKGIEIKHFGNLKSRSRWERDERYWLAESYQRHGECHRRPHGTLKCWRWMLETSNQQKRQRWRSTTVSPQSYEDSLSIC